jgi:hypothetical protein
MPWQGHQSAESSAITENTNKKAQKNADKLHIKSSENPIGFNIRRYPPPLARSARTLSP